MSTQTKWIGAAVILAIGAALIAYGVATEYVLLGALVLLCPLMMLFMGGHDRGRESGKDRPGPSSDATRDAADK